MSIDANAHFEYTAFYYGNEEKCENVTINAMILHRYANLDVVESGKKWFFIQFYFFIVIVA